MSPSPSSIMWVSTFFNHVGGYTMDALIKISHHCRPRCRDPQRHVALGLPQPAHGHHSMVTTCRFIISSRSLSFFRHWPEIFCGVASPSLTLTLIETNTILSLLSAAYPTHHVQLPT